MINILFIAFEFPPFSSGGVHRPLRMIRQLQSQGFNPIVITIDHKEVYGEKKCDASLLEKVPPGAIVIRTGFNKGGWKQKFIETGYSFEADVTFLGWEMDFKSKVAQAISEYQPQAVFITLPPFSIGRLGLWVKQRFQLPLIVDMRDAWSNWVMAPYASKLHYQKIKKQEYTLLKKADAVLVTSPQTIKDFQELYEDIPASKYHFIPNGFDQYLAEEFILPFPKAKLRIGYVGSFYYNPVSQKLVDDPWYRKKPYQYLQYVPRKENWLYRSPNFFFKALAYLFKDFPEYRSKVELMFAGSKPVWFDEMVATYDLADVIRHVGRVSQKESLKLQKECDVLLLTSAKVEGGHDYSIAGKTFEYFSLRKPVLGFVCPGAQQWILENSGVAVLADPDNSAQSALQLKKLLDEGYNLKPNQEFIDQFQTDIIMDRLQQVFKSVLKK